MQRLEVSGAVRPIYESLSVKWIIAGYKLYLSLKWSFNKTRPSREVLLEKLAAFYVFQQIFLVLCITKFNPLTPNDLYDSYMGRTAPLTSKRPILYIYSTNIGTEYFKQALYCPFFFLFKMQFVS